MCSQMFFQILIIIICLSAGIGIFIYFHLKNSSMNKMHLKKIASLKRNFLLNSEQIRYRNTEIGRYNFLEYNLNDALVIQPKIILH